MQRMPKSKTVNDPDLEAYDPLIELFLSVSPSWEVFRLNLQVLIRRILNTEFMS